MGIKRELRDLRQKREDGVRALGQIAVEMYGRRDIDIKLLRDHAGELAVVDERIRDLEARLRLART